MSEETKEAFAHCLSVSKVPEQELAALRLYDAWEKRFRLVREERDELYEELKPFKRAE